MFDEISRTKLKKRTRCTYAQHSTGNSLSEALIFASINPQYNILFMELP